MAVERDGHPVVGDHGLLDGRKIDRAAQRREQLVLVAEIGRGADGVATSRSLSMSSANRPFLPYCNSTWRRTND